MTFWHADEAWLIASQTRVAAHLPGCTLFHTLQVLPSRRAEWELYAPVEMVLDDMISCIRLRLKMPM